MRQNWLSNRVFNPTTTSSITVVTPGTTLIVQPWKIMSIGLPERAYIGRFRCCGFAPSLSLAVQIFCDSFEILKCFLLGVFFYVGGHSSADDQISFTPGVSINLK